MSLEHSAPEVDVQSSIKVCSLLDEFSSAKATNYCYLELFSNSCSDVNSEYR